MRFFPPILLYFFCLITDPLLSIAPKGLFENYPNQFFIETGSHSGYGIDLAIKAKFPNIRSIELNHSFYKLCCSKFKNYPNVKLYLGDSSISLWDMISDISEPITFWLDGHYSGLGTSKGKQYSPIMQELRQVKKHPVKNHTIIIDDVRLMGGKYFDYVSLEEIKKYLLSINPKYQFLLYDGYRPRDILVAYVQ